MPAAPRPSPGGPVAEGVFDTYVPSTSSTSAVPNRPAQPPETACDLPPPHLRDHLPPRRGQDDAHRKTALFRRRNPSRRRSEGARAKPPRAVGLDEDRAAARHLGHLVGDDLRTRRHHLQPARHAGPRGLQRRHLSHPHRGRFRGHGHRRRQGHRAADAQIVRGLPPAVRPDHHLRQQGRSRRPSGLRTARRDRRHAGIGRRTDELAGRHGRRVRGRARPHHQHDQPPRRRQPRLSRQDRNRPHAVRPLGRGDRTRPGRLCGVRWRGLSQRRPDAGLFRLRAQGLRRRRTDRRARRACPAAARAACRTRARRTGQRRSHRLRIQGAGEHGPQPPRPHRLHAAVFGHVQTRHEAHPHRARQADRGPFADPVLRAESRSRRRGLPRRHHRHPQPRHAARGRYLVGARRRPLHRPAQFRARNPAPRPAEGPDQDQAAAQGARRHGRRGRDAGLLPRNRQQLDHRRRRPAPARSAAQPPGGGI